MRDQIYKIIESVFLIYKDDGQIFGSDLDLTSFSLHKDLGLRAASPAILHRSSQYTHLEPDATLFFHSS